MYEEVIADFAKRTSAKHEILRQHKEKGDNVFEVTQHINSKLGLMVFPQQKYIDKIPDKTIQDLGYKGWIIPKVRDDFLQIENLQQLIRYLRNAIRIKVFLLLLCLLSVQTATGIEKGLNQKAFLGVYLSPLDDLKEFDTAYRGKTGIAFPRVIGGSAAEKYGLLSGDILLQYDGYDFSKLSGNQLKETFRNYLLENKQPGDQLKIKILRLERVVIEAGKERVLKRTELDRLVAEQHTGFDRQLSIFKRSRELEIELILGRRPFLRKTAPPENNQLFPLYEQLSSPLSKLTEKLVRENYSDYHDLIKRYADDEWWDDGFRLNLFRYLHRNPLKLQPVLELETDHLEEILISGEFEKAFQFVVELLDETADIDMSLSCQTLSDCVNSIVAIVNSSVDLRQVAFSQLSTQEMEFITKNVPVLTDRFIESFYLDHGMEDKITYNIQKVLELAHKVDFKALFRAGAFLQKLSSKTFLKKLKVHLDGLEPYKGALPSSLDIRGELLLVKETAAGPLIIGGSGDNRYIAGSAVIIDLAGNDLYLNEFDLNMPVSVQIDYSGDDQYSATGRFSQGAALLGNSLLIDLSGNDHYSAPQFAQGAAILGTGVLIDFSGDDSYRGGEYHQGTAFWGMGLLFDLSGNDQYSASLYAQGVGGVKGVGLLYDQSGQDTYYASGKYPSSYGTKGIFKGASQGLGIGFREQASGGIGILLDSAGEDNFVAGNFSQGGGYFFGLGILRNSGNDSDHYQATHYGQGFSAHSAIGLLLDTGGDDYYQGLHAAVQGVAWDLGIAALIDFSGNDYYDSRDAGFSKAASAHNGFSILLDLAGKDHYLGNQSILARNSPNGYHGGSSFSLFIDSGGEEDLYPAGYFNNQMIKKKEAGLVWDY